ncbi:MAG: hypothetical protein D3906_16330, partial [Candidatus Electrothrix sp. AUS1_2]|nr:hypothetical protein [Candidatus Electrothrix sp. AUS1_2]
MTSALLTTVLLVVSYNWRVNHHGRYFHLTQHEREVDRTEWNYERVDVWQGRPKGWDFFGQGTFLYETSIIRKDMDVDWVVTDTPIIERATAQQELINRLQSAFRFSGSMRDGLYGKGFALGQRLLKNNNPVMSKWVLQILGQVRTEFSVGRLQEGLDEREWDDDVEAEAVRSLAILRDIRRNPSDLRRKSALKTVLDQFERETWKAIRIDGDELSSDDLDLLRRKLENPETEGKVCRQLMADLKKQLLLIYERNPTTEENRRIRKYQLGEAFAACIVSDIDASSVENISLLLGHPLYLVRQGAIRTLVADTDAALIGRITNHHQTP